MCRSLICAIIACYPFLTACQGSNPPANLQGIASPGITATIEKGNICAHQASEETVELFPRDLTSQFDPIIEKVLAQFPAAGFALAVQCTDSPIYFKGYGFADLEAKIPTGEYTIYEVGSITKQITAAAVMRLVDDGALRLDDPLGEHLSDLPTEWRAISIRQLLNQTSGLPDHYALLRDEVNPDFDLYDDHTPDELLAYFYQHPLPLEFPPGERFQSSNTGYVLLGALIEQLSGQTYPDYLQANIFTPLGLDNISYCAQAPKNKAKAYIETTSGLQPAPPINPGIYSSAGAICSNAIDLIKWQRGLVSGQVVNRNHYLNMQTHSYLTDGTPIPYGLGLSIGQIGNRRAVYHEGGTLGFSSWLVYYPEERLSIALLANTFGPNFKTLLEATPLLVDTLLTTNY